MKTTKNDLVETMWAALDSTRGAQRMPQACTNLLALLLLKRVSDTSDEDEGGSALQLPPSARWSSLRLANPADLPRAIRTLAEGFESANESVPRGLISELDFGAGRAGVTHSLARLVSLLSGVKLAKEDVEVGSLGEASENLLQRLAETQGKRAADFLTPSDVRDLVVSLLDPKPGASLCDPACGAATFLTGAARHSAQIDPSAVVKLYGQEKNRESWRLAHLNLLLHEQVAAAVALGDSLRAPALSEEDGSLRKFDAVLTNPPFGLGRWGHREAEVDPHGRFRYGLPPARTADFAFVQHVLASLHRGGRAVMVIAPGVLFRAGREGSIRERIVRDDLIEAVISLGPNLFHGTSIPTAILVLANGKEANKADKILFINASERFVKVRGRNLLSPEDREAIIGAYESFADDSGFARVVERAEIEANNYVLDVKRYVQLPLAAEDCVDLVSLRQRVIDLEMKRAGVLENMNKLLLRIEGVSHGA